MRPASAFRHAREEVRVNNLVVRPRARPRESARRESRLPRCFITRAHVHLRQHIVTLALEDVRLVLGDVGDLFARFHDGIPPTVMTMELARLKFELQQMQ